jgi:hypothetical protein
LQRPPHVLAAVGTRSQDHLAELLAGPPPLEEIFRLA